MASDAVFECTVGDVAALGRNSLVGGPFGSDLVSRDYVSSGVPVIRGSNMGHGRWVGGEFAYVVPEKADALAANCAKRGDLVFTQRGTLGQVALVPEKGADRYLISQSQMKLTVDAQKADALFLYYVFTSAEQQAYIRQNAIQTGVPHTNLGILRNTPLTLPPLAKQEAIAAALGALDDKIELNQRMNATLEAMARALFDNWTQLHANTIEEHIVQELIDNKVLLIGDGYRAKNSEFAADGLPFVRAGNLKVDGLDLAGAEVLSAHSTTAAGHKVGKVDDIAFTSKGTVGRITRVSPKTGPFVYSPQVCFWRSVARDTLNPNVLYRWMRSADFTRQVTAVSTQTDMAPYVSLQDQKKMVIQLPPPSAQSEIAEHLEPIDARIAANAEQSRTLATLRDTLLPKLLSGELNLPAALLAAQAGVAAAASNI